MKGLKADPSKGINEDEVEQREKFFGSNQFEVETLRSFWDFLMDALSDPILKLLLFMSVVSVVIEEVTALPEDRSIAWVEGFAIFSGRREK